MPALRDMALTVEERTSGEFFWVLLEATANDKPDEFIYARRQTALAGETSYSSALAVGAAALRKAVGTAD